MSQNGQSARVGTIVEIKGVVVDAVFPGEMPSIYNALEIKVPASAGEESERVLVAEVQQHLGDGRIRAIAMDATDGLARGLEVTDTGGPITVPVGEPTLGRIFNVLGEAIDNGDPIATEERLPTHRQAPALEMLSPATAVSATGAQVVDLLAPHVTG